MEYPRPIGIMAQELCRHLHGMEIFIRQRMYERGCISRIAGWTHFGIKEGCPIKKSSSILLEGRVVASSERSRNEKLVAGSE